MLKVASAKNQRVDTMKHRKREHGAQRNQIVLLLVLVLVIDKRLIRGRGGEFAQPAEQKGKSVLN